MAQSKILLDSNAYFRLAQELHPLLFEEFGSERYCLYVLPELDQEYDRQPRLHRKFEWASRPEYADNRKTRLILSRKERTALATVKEFMWDTVQSEIPGPSPVDVAVLSYGYVLGIPVVTDDPDMRQLAEIYEVRTITALELLKIMMDSEKLDMATICRIVTYWQFNEDLPTGFNRNYRDLFGEEPPI